MSFALLLRTGVLLILTIWSFLSYCFIRSSFGVVQPGISVMPLIVILSLLLMIPMIAVSALWLLPDIRVHQVADVRVKKGLCANCGHSMHGNRNGVCTECGDQQRTNQLSTRSMLLSCAVILVSCWITGSIAGEILVRSDERAFIRLHVDSSKPVEHTRQWPLWGALQWDPMTGTARSTME